MTLKLLTLEEVKQSITMSEAICAMESAFKQLAAKNVELPLRTAVAVDKKGVTLTMPAYLKENRTLGLKIVSVFPENTQHNKASINGTILLLDAATGEPLMMMDANYLTALRTGAVSGLATQYFSNDNSSTLAIIGTGAQAETQLLAVAAVRSIKHVYVWSRKYENSIKFAKKFELQFNIEPCENISSALQYADIICTATASKIPLVQLHHLKANAHINAIGSHDPSMHEISSDVLGQSVVIVDQKESALKESGEIIDAIAEKVLSPDSIIEIGSYLQNKTSNYKNKLSLFKSVGLAIQDLSVAEVVYKNAIKKNLGIAFKLD